MNDSTVITFGRLLACQARVFGMLAENEARKARGESPAYSGDDFFAEAQAIEAIARNV